MFNKKERASSKELDLRSLNIILHTSKKLIKVFYYAVIITLLLLVTYILKEWKILNFLGELLKVISPIFIGLIIAWILDPLVDKFEEKKMPRIFGCIIVYIILLAVIALFFYLIIPAFGSQISDFIATLPDIIKDLTKSASNILESFGSKFNFDISIIEAQVISSITELSKDLTTSIPTFIFNFGKGIISTGVSIVLGIMVGFYMLYDWDKIKLHLEHFLPVKWRPGYHELSERINNQLRKYLQGVFSVMLLVFITQSIGLTIAGLKAPLIFALFCAVTDIIPYFGPYIGAIPAIIVGFTISPITGICVIIAILIVQLLENNFYQPIIMGKTMSLHPVTIMIGLLIFEHFFGILGMVIATPVIACLKVIVMFINEKLNVKEKITGEEPVLEK